MTRVPEPAAPSAPDRAATPRTGLVVTALLSLFVALCVHGLVWDSPTVDEFAHLPAGYAYLRSGDFSHYPANPPLVKLWTALPLLALDPPPEAAPTAALPPTSWQPWIYGTDFMQRNRERYRLLFLLGRLPVVALGVLLGLLVHRWASQLYGRSAGAVALAFYALCPSVVAHAHLATIDVGAALASTAALYALWRFLDRPTASRLAVCGVALGLAQLTKFSAALLIPLFVLLAALVPPRLAGRERWRLAAATAGALAAIFAICWLVVCAGYLGGGLGRPLGAFEFRSQGFAALAGWLPGWPSPLPAPYVSGLDEMRLYSESGEFPSYLFGRWSESGFRSYYLVTLLLKTPLPLLVAWAAAPWWPRRWRRDELFLVLPALVLVAAFSFTRIGYGVRYLLPALPLLMVWAARGWPELARRRRGRAAGGLLLAAYASSVLLATPNTIDYFNLLAPRPPDRALLDSNLDWGQGLERLSAYLERERLDSIGLAYFGHVDPALYGIDAHAPDPARDERVAVSANFLHGYPYLTFRDGRMTAVPPRSVEWLADLPRERYLGGGIWILRVPRGAGAEAPPAPP